MPMPMPGYFMMPMVHPIVPIPGEPTIDGDYNYEKLEEGEIYEEEYIEASRDYLFQFLLNTRLYLNSLIDRVRRIAMY
jgi:hypothetical protein